MRTISGTRPSSTGWQLVGTSDRDSLASVSPCCAMSSDHTCDEVAPRYRQRRGDAEIMPTVRHTFLLAVSAAMSSLGAGSAAAALRASADGMPRARAASTRLGDAMCGWR